MSDFEATGRCYCGDVQYTITTKPVLKGQCHCRECQYLSGGAPQYYMAVPGNGFEYTRGAPRSFQRSDIPNPVSREFCQTCGTQIVTRRHDFDGVILKIGTLDDPKQFKAPQVAIFTKDKMPFHIVPEGMPAFEGLPILGRK